MENREYLPRLDGQLSFEITTKGRYEISLAISEHLHVLP